MLYIHSFTFNPFQENTYIIYNDKKECWIVDPGMYEPSEIADFNKYIVDNELVPKAIINTHTHIDHIFGVQELVKKYQIPFLIHKEDQPVLNGAAGSAMLFGFQFTDTPSVDGYIDESEPYKLGDDELQVLFTPGHSPGSISFYYAKGNWVLGGDVLFSGSIGRTDLPGGNFDTLINSIKTQLFSLPDHTTVYSGHGPETSIGQEKASNPFLHG